MTKEKQELVQAKPTEVSMSSNMTVDGILSQRQLITDVMQKAMKRGVDFGRIGDSEKDSLFQPGAQKLCMLFRLGPVFESKEIFDGQHMTIKSNCTIKHAPTGMILGSGEGLCTTKEKKYAKRKEGGRIVDNANLADLYNTVLKMANKRALVAAVLNVTAAGDIFTQDLAEDEEPLIVPDTEQPPKPSEKTPAEVVKKAEEKHAEAKANAYQPETPAPEAKSKNGNAHKWKGTFSSAEQLELPDGSPAWSLRGADGVTFKTADPKHVQGGIEANVEYEITYHINGKGSLVVDKIRATAGVL